VALEAAGTIDILTGIADITPQLTALFGRESSGMLITTVGYRPTVALTLVAPAMPPSILRLTLGLELARMPLTLKADAAALPPEPARLGLGVQGKREEKSERKRNGGEAQGGGGGSHGDLKHPGNMSLTPRDAGQWFVETVLSLFLANGARRVHGLLFRLSLDGVGR